jgi:Rieske Fe-S protein
MSVQQLSRRSVLTGSVAAVAAAVAGFVVARNSDAAKAKSPTSAANGYGPSTRGTDNNSPKPIVALAKVTGDGIIAGGVVLTRDASGGVQGRSATCTHQGCSVLAPHDGKVVCPCHGSEFDPATGRVLRGPATQPLPAVPVRVQGDEVYRA